MRTAVLENGKHTGINLANLAAKAAEGKVLAEDLVDIGKEKLNESLEKDTKQAKIVSTILLITSSIIPGNRSASHLGWG